MIACARPTAVALPEMNGAARQARADLGHHVRRHRARDDDGRHQTLRRIPACPAGADRIRDEHEAVRSTRHGHGGFDLLRRDVDDRDVVRRPVRGVELLSVGADGDAAGKPADAVDHPDDGLLGGIDDQHRPRGAGRDVEELAVGRQHGRLRRQVRRLARGRGLPGRLLEDDHLLRDVLLRIDDRDGRTGFVDREGDVPARREHERPGTHAGVDACHAGHRLRIDRGQLVGGAGGGVDRPCRRRGSPPPAVRRRSLSSS